MRYQLSGKTPLIEWTARHGRLRRTSRRPQAEKETRQAEARRRDNWRSALITGKNTAGKQQLQQVPAPECVCVCVTWSGTFILLADALVSSAYILMWASFPAFVLLIVTNQTFTEWLITTSQPCSLMAIVHVNTHLTFARFKCTDFQEVTGEDAAT